MGVGPHNDVAGIGQLLGYELVADPAAGVEEQAAGFGGELPQEKMVVGERTVGAGGGMVDEDRRPGGISQRLLLARLELAHREGSGGILYEDQVHRRDDDVAGFGVRPGFGAEYLFA